ncbi:MAG TPA: sodium/glutamate symporter [Pyrinomonadaceae bacterium]|nr:sodium/glutamate symporter [Pyrinomonadaceae bacterium]
MEITALDGLRAVKFDLIMTLALAALSLFAGSWIQRRARFLERSSIPAAAVGGLLFALLVLVLRTTGTLAVTLDTTLRAPLQNAFFTTIGLGATLSLLRAGGWRMGLFWLIATGTALVQNAVGIGLASALGAPAALGIICGALTLTGGPSTGLAWAGEFEKLGVSGAGSLIIASALFGIFIACLVGNPVATFLIRRFKLAKAREENTAGPGEEEFWALSPTVNRDDERREEKEEGKLTGGVLLHNLLLILAVMGLGAVVSFWLRGAGVTMPDYIGAMVFAAALRNVDERTGWFRLDARAVEILGGIALALFLVIALMSLELWKIAGLALPMVVILSAQVLVTIVYAVLTSFLLMGRDYEAAVTTSGHIGFGLGTTPNAVANMEALTARYAPAPRSFLIVPVVGAFFIDLSNLLIITAFVNFIR